MLFMVCIYAMAARADTKPTFQGVICSSDEGHKELIFNKQRDRVYVLTIAPDGVYSGSYEVEDWISV